MAREIATNVERMKHPPCGECGATSLADAQDKCHCSGDKDDCHGCQLWPDDEPQPTQQGGGDVFAYMQDCSLAGVAFLKSRGEPAVFTCRTIKDDLHTFPLYTAPPSAPVGVEGVSALPGEQVTMTWAQYAELRALAQLPAAGAVATASELGVIETLLELAHAAWCLADNAEDAGGEGLTIERRDFAVLEKHLDTLDHLPDDQPGYTMGEAAKARWALRRMLTTQHQEPKP